MGRREYSGAWVFCFWYPAEPTKTKIQINSEFQIRLNSGHCDL
ncbi:Uncharacterized protein dnm_053610 [Desulfonema magnum]|uniref:Uncharacterized protein n=1 Tax=Desulfonema magnum TaxID=45655 RepID=A0A975BPH9_9BACT|nr:Uncharacterized protein dnm_053610 [Desulfonema magnum]